MQNVIQRISMAINVLKGSRSAQTLDSQAIQADIANIKGRILSPAGPTNTSNYVYEFIAGVQVKAWAIEGSEALTTLLSASGAENHWLWETHGKDIQWKAEYSHLLREGMIVVVNAAEGGKSKVYRVKAGTTAAERAVNPTDDAQVAYEPWSFT